MENLIQSDIFFFVTTIAVVIVSIVVIVAGIYLVKTLKDIRETIRIVKEEASLIIDDVDELRSDIKGKVKLVSGFVGAITSTAFIHNILKGKKKK
jgi:uncharacterized protein YoxC